MRDSERQRTYDAEYQAFIDTVYEAPQGLLALEECARIITRTDAWMAHHSGTVRVRQARPDSQHSSANRLSNEIRIAYGHDNLSVLCHELAHLVSVDGHGANYRAAEIAVVRLALGSAAAGRLADSFRRARLEVSGPDDWSREIEGVVADRLIDPDEAVSRHVRRIRALINKASSTTPDEAQALKNKAYQLASRYGISAALMVSDTDASDLHERRLRLGGGAYVAVRCDLLNAVARAHWCRVVWHNDRDGRVVSVVGHRGDVSTVLALFGALDHAAMLEVSQVATAGNVLRYRRSWLRGFTSAVAQNLRDANTAAMAHADGDAPGSTELVLLARDQRVEQYQKKLFPHVSTTSSDAAVSRQAFTQGVARGRRVDVGASRITSAPRAIDRTAS